MRQTQWMTKFMNSHSKYTGSILWYRSLFSCPNLLLQIENTNHYIHECKYYFCLRLYKFTYLISIKMNISSSSCSWKGTKFWNNPTYSSVSDAGGQLSVNLSGTGCLVKVTHYRNIGYCALECKITRPFIWDCDRPKWTDTEPNLPNLTETIGSVRLGSFGNFR